MDTPNGTIWEYDPTTFEPRLPQHCSPTTPFLRHFSEIFHTCIPTPLAFISTLLGSLSILSWLFAQLPQIVKNHRLKSTSGLSIYFLVEWFLGDLSNLLGAVLTNQATWQIVVGAYYCFVDILMVSQWIWFDNMGRDAKCEAIQRDHALHGGGGRGPDEDAAKAIAGGERLSRHTPQDIPGLKEGFFRTPYYGSFQSTKEGIPSSSCSSSDGRTIYRTQAQLLPSPSPRTILFVSFLIALANASPVSDSRSIPTEPGLRSRIPPMGTVLSWTSTVLYLFSRMPQLVKNFRKRSTAGLSPLLFLAAFLGNLFYSASLLCNPCLWNDYSAYGGSGWVGASGNDRGEWAKRAAPFFLGAAGVLGMDGGVGVQFWLWGERSKVREQMMAEGDPPPRRKVIDQGWMRGWIPSVSGTLTPVASWVDFRRAFSPARGPVTQDDSQTGLLEASYPQSGQSR